MINQIVDMLFFLMILFVYVIGFVWFVVLYARPTLKKKFSVKSGRLRIICNYFISMSIFFAPVFLAYLIQPQLPIPQIVLFPLGVVFVIFAVYLQVQARMKIGFLPGGPFPGLRKEETLITTGIYGIIRHPIYVGVTLWQIGFALMFNAAFAFIFFMAYTLVYIPIIYLEEKGLEEKYGAQYIEYKRKTHSLIPKIF
jgi:protein-S-isoprenylcysteine O-methyltransferase Ste14